MDKFKGLSLVLLGMVIGLGYAVACGSGDDEEEATMPVIPGVGLAMAQSGCTRWEVVQMHSRNELGTIGTQASSTGESGADIFAIPTGWTPLTGVQDHIWLTRCAQ